MGAPNSSVPSPGKISQGIHSTWEATRDLLHLVGYLLAASLILWALFKPAIVKNYMQAMGIKEVKKSDGSIDVTFDATDTADNLTKLSGRVDAIQKSLQDLTAATSNPEIKTKLLSVANETAVLNQDVSKADESLRNALAKSTKQAEASQPSTPLIGWVFLGRTDESIQHWDTKSQTVPMPIDPAVGPKFNPGQSLTLRSSAYLRADGPEYAITAHPVIGAVPAGATVRIIDLRPNSIRSGGKYLWAKVEYEP